MIILHFGTNNTGINRIPVCVAWYDTNTKKGAYYVIKPSEYWVHDKSVTGCRPTYEDCANYGLPASYVSKRLSSELTGKVVYSQNPILTRDCIDRLYGTCGEELSFMLENLHDFIPDENYNRYITACNQLANKIRCNNPMGYVYALSGIVRIYSKTEFDNDVK